MTVDTLKEVKLGEKIFCYECGRCLSFSDCYTQYPGTYQEQPASVVICERCQQDWKLVLHAEARKNSYGAIRYGRLVKRIEQLENSRNILGTMEQVMARRWLKQKSGLQPPPTPQKPAPKVEIEVSPLPTQPPREREWPTSDLIESFERDVSRAPRGFEVIHIKRSESFKELCRRRPFQVIVGHLRSRPWPDDSPIKTAWGHPLLRMQLCLDPDNESAPDSCDDLAGWIAWAESMIRKTEATSIPT